MTHGKREKNRKLIIILIAIVIATLGYVYVNIEDVSLSTFSESITADEPDVAVSNASGYKAVIGSFGTEIMIINPEDKLQASVRYNVLSKSTPRAAECLAINEDTLYILDSIVEDDGTTVIGERILAYDLNGSYMDTLFSTASEDEDSDYSEENSDDDYSEDACYRIASISCNEERVYALCIYDDSQVSVADITDGYLKVIHKFSSIQGDSFEGNYQPKEDITTIISCDGELYCFKGDTASEHIAIGEDSQIDKALITDEKNLIVLDVNTNKLISYSPSGEATVLAETGAENFDLCGAILTFADPNDYSIHTVNLNSGEENILKSFSSNVKTRIKAVAAWAAALTGISVLLALVVLLILEYVKNKKIKEESEVDGNKPKLMTTGSLYGRAFIFMMLAFVVTAFMTGKFYHDKTLTQAKNDVTEAAYVISMNSSQSVGDQLENITSQKHYGSEEYEAVLSYIDYVCLKQFKLDGNVDISCNLYRLDKNSDDVYVIVDEVDYNRIGTKYDNDEQEGKKIKESFDYVRKDYFNETTVKYNNGTSLYQVYAPVYNSSKEIVGAVVTMVNTSGFLSGLNMELLDLFLEIFTLLAGLSMLLIEGGFAFKVSKIQENNHRKGLTDTTLVEGDRIVNILLMMPGEIFLMFYTLMVYDILKAGGIENSAVLLALPITIEGAAYAVIKTIGSPIVKHNPKQYMYIGQLLSIAGFIVLLAADAWDSYPLIVAGGVVESFGNALAFSAGRATKLSGKVPNEEYKLMIFSGSEPAISGAIGVSLGAVVRGAYGNTGLIVFSIVMTVISFPVVKFFVGNDIAVTKDTANVEKKKHVAVFAEISKIADVLLKPKMIIVNILSTLPLGILVLFSSYLLPMVNEIDGLPDVIIGSVTLLIKLLVLLVIPEITKYILKFNINNTYIISIGMGVLAAVLFIYGVDGSMKTFAVVLFIIEVVKVLFLGLSEDIYIEEADKAGAVVNDLTAVWELFYGIGRYVGPFIISLMMVKGTKSIGYWWAAVCAVCMIASLILSKAEKGNAENAGQ